MSDIRHIGDLRDDHHQMLTVHSMNGRIRVISGGPTIMLTPEQTREFFLLLLDAVIDVDARRAAEETAERVQEILVHAKKVHNERPA